ncbi:nuclear transport factor 2 family protein [Paenarthrobacter sp. RAF54_2]|uniref:nuclear transport factor 2 family protein n=1 Tax=Paenarthrobacter sp. RAF54_2 TaxID=3233061 RepID=UPI003F9B5B54
MTPQPHKVWEAYNEAENTRDFTAMAKLVAPDISITVNGIKSVSSAEEDQSEMRHVMDMYPDYRRILVEILSCGNRAVARWQMLGSSPTAPVLNATGCSIVTVKDGQITDAYLYYDSAALDSVLGQH